MEKLTWRTEKRKFSELLPYKYNPRILTEKRKEILMNSIDKFGFVEIPAINLDNTLLAGHQRTVAMIALGRGDEEVDVRIPNRMLTEQEVKEYNVQSNVSIGYWDQEMLENLFSDLDLAKIGLDLSKIEIPDDIKPFKIEEEKDFVVRIPKKPVSQEGDVLEFHSIDKNLVHRLKCGSSTNNEDVTDLFGDDHARLLLTDPPYNVNYTGGTADALTIKNDNMSTEQFGKFLFDFYTNAFQFLVPGSPVYIFHADSEGANFRSKMVDSGFKLSQCLVWVKNSIVMGRQDYHWQHEPILYGWKPGSHYWYGDRSQRTVINWDKPLRNDDHPTMKPVGLVEYFIQNSSQRFDIITDLFSGSGTTLIAGEKTKRHVRAMELDPVYVDVNIRRWHTYMVDNGLDFIIKRNGRELKENEIQEYYSRLG